MWISDGERGLSGSGEVDTWLPTKLSPRGAWKNHWKSPSASIAWIQGFKVYYKHLFSYIDVINPLER